VAAFLEGYGEAADEWIVVGAHHDHIGSFDGEGDTIFNGADDNASGVSGVLELAEQFAGARNGGPRYGGQRNGSRSMVFMTFAAEEIGLFGSYALDFYDLIDFDNVAFMLNLDMIGRNPEDAIRIYGDGFTPGLGDIVRNTGTVLPIEFMGTDYFPFSDMAVFHENEIPFLMLYTGEHPDYHGTGDHAEKLAYDRMVELLGLSRAILERIAGDEGFPSPAGE
jgi:Zn-dependent M28 family amino/carboxypeptidase